MQDVPLGGEVLPDGGVGEAPVVQRLAGVADGGGGARRVDLVQAGVVLAPEGGAPGLVDRLDGAVGAGQPAAEVCGAGVAVAGRDGDAVLVVDVPHRQRRVVAVALGEAGGDARGGGAVGGAAVADGAARAELLAHALRRHRQRLGVCPVEPGGWCHGGRAEVDADAVGVQQVEHPVEPAEVVLPLGGFQQGPGEDPHAHHRDAGLPHQPDVLLPDVFRPLFGVVVATEGEPGEALGAGLRHGSLPLIDHMGTFTHSSGGVIPT